MAAEDEGDTYEHMILSVFFNCDLHLFVLFVTWSDILNN